MIIQAVLTITVSYGMRLGLIGALLDVLLVQFLVAREIRLGICGLKHHVEKKFAETLSNPDRLRLPRICRWTRPVLPDRKETAGHR